MNSLEKLEQDVHQKAVWERLRMTDVIVIDEMSMVENLFLQRFDTILKEAKGNHRRPFGGVQMILMGDVSSQLYRLGAHY